MAKGNPFAGKQAPPFGKGGSKGGGKAPPFAKKDKGMPPPMDIPPQPAFKRGGAAKRSR